MRRNRYRFRKVRYIHVLDITFISILRIIVVYINMFLKSKCILNLMSYATPYISIREFNSEISLEL